MIPTIWHESYHQPGAAAWLSTRKQIEVVRACEGMLAMRAGAEPDWDSIARVHDPAYVRAVRTGEPRALAESQGFTWSAAWAESVGRIWANHTHAARLALRGERAVFHPVSGAHHATRAHGGGYCTFDFLVGAARAVLDEGSATSVLILDLDTHQGNGNFELATDPRILQFDVSGSSYGVPEIDEPGRYYRMVRNEEEYSGAHARLPEMLDRKPSLVLYQAGMDCWEEDPVGGITGMNALALGDRDRFVFEECAARKIPIVFNLAGGYVEGGGTVALHVQTVKIACEVFS